MKNDINWDNYYDGYSPYENEEVPEDAILHVDYKTDDFDYIDYVRYLGPKTNATIKQIVYYMKVRQQNSKFLYNEETVVILLDYSEQIIDKWKSGTVLYCHGEKLYSTEKDRTNLSVIDRKLFRAGSSGEVRVYVFWKETSPNYNFINGIFVLNKEPYQIAESDGFRWIFPLSLITSTVFRMPERFCFNLDVDRIEKSIVNTNQKQDELQLIDFNNTEYFDLSDKKPIYKGVPQKKSSTLIRYEALERNRKVAANALRIADFKCEVDPSHPTFIRKSQNVPYTEPHHLIPLAFSGLFKYSIDIEENIVSLCSNCHNHIHYGKDPETIIKKLFAQRKTLLEQAGILLNEQELLSMYGLSENNK